MNKSKKLFLLIILVIGFSGCDLPWSSDKDQTNDNNQDLVDQGDIVIDQVNINTNESVDQENINTNESVDQDNININVSDDPDGDRGGQPDDLSGEYYINLKDLPEFTKGSSRELPGVQSVSLPNDLNLIADKTPLSIEFSVPMNQEATQKALIIDPPLAGDFHWDDHTMVFTPRESYQTGVTYSMLLSNEALSADGLNFPEHLQRKFRVTDDLLVLAVTPNEKEVPVETDLSIIFNQPIFELGTIDDLENHDFGIKVEPSFDFRYRLAGTNTLQIQGQMPSVNDKSIIEHRLPYSTNFKIIIPKGFQSLNGSLLKEEKIFELSTPVIELISQPNSIINPFLPFEFTFNQAVDLESFKSKFTISSDDPNEKYEIFYKEFFSDDQEKLVVDYKTVQVMSSYKFWGYRKPYSFVLESGVQGLEGNKTSMKPFSNDYITAHFITLESPTTEHIKLDQDFVLKFDHPPLSLEEVKKFLSVNKLFIGNFDENMDLALEASSDQNQQSLEISNNQMNSQYLPLDYKLAYKQVCKDPDLRGTWREDDCEKVNDQRRIIVQLKEKLDNQDQIIIKVNQGLKSKITIDPDRPDLIIPDLYLNVAYTLQNDYEFAFSTAPKAEILGFFANEGDYREFCIFSNNPLDEKSFSDNLHFEPSLNQEITLSSYKVNISSWDFERMERDQKVHDCKVEKYINQYAIKVESKFNFDTTYKGILNADLQDIYGQTIGNDYIFDFRTKPLDDQDIQITVPANELMIAPSESAPIAIFRTVNVPDKLKIDICRTDIKTLQERSNDILNYYSDKIWIPDEASCQYFYSYDQEMPDRAWDEQYLKINLQEILQDDFQNGTYLVIASNPRFNQIIYERGYGADNEGKKVISYKYNKIMVTDLALSAKRDQDKALVWLSRMSDGQPVIADIYYAEHKPLGYRETLLGKTDEAGILDIPEIDDYTYLMARTTDDETMVLRNWNIGDSGSFDSGNQSYIFTDRPIYRPGDELKGKIILYKDNDLVLKAIEDYSLEIKLMDNNYNELPLKIDKIKTNDQGSAEFAFVIPGDIKLGNLHLNFCRTGFLSKSECYSHQVAIEEYKKPEFEIEITSDNETYFHGDQAEIMISARYYFGGPVQDAQSGYSLKRKVYVFNKYTEDNGFIFNEDGGLWKPYYEYASHIYPPFESEIEHLKTETIDSNDQGIALIKEAISLPYKESKLDEKAEKLNRNKLIDFKPLRLSKEYIIETNTADSNQNPIFSEYSFVANAGSQYIGIKSDKLSVKAGNDLIVRSIIVDTQGKPLVGKKGKLYFIYKNQIEDQDNSSQIPWNSKSYYIEEEIIETKEIVSDSNPIDTVFTPKADKVGTYRVVAETVDEKGQLQRSSFDFFVYDENFVDISQLETKKIDLIADQESYQVGDQAVITLKSPLVNKQSKYLVSTERGLLHSYNLIEFDEDPVYSLEITSEMIPNMHICFLGQQFGADLQVAYGCKDLQISTDSKKLDITLTTNKDQYLPGEKVKLDIAVKSGSVDREAEIAIIVVDKANLALIENAREDILKYLYANKSNAVRTITNLIKIITKIDLGDNIVLENRNQLMHPPMAGDMSMEMDGVFMTKSMNSIAESESFDMAGGTGADLSQKKRSDFKDTAFFQGIINTDSTGDASLEFELPDNLTAWKIIAIGLNKDFYAGENAVEVNTQKPLMVRPQLPRFVRFGDEIFLYANIHNESGRILDISATMEVQNLTLVSDQEQINTVENGGYYNFIWQVNAKESQLDQPAIITIKAESNDLLDEVEIRIPVLDLSTPETVASSGVTSALSFFEKVRLSDYVIRNLGDLTIKTNATLANFLDSGLEYLINYPYGCNEQIASKLLGLVLYNGVTQLENFADKITMPEIKDEKGLVITYEQAVKKALDNLANSQRYDGGWGYWLGSDNSSPTLTSHIIYVLSVLEQYDINFKKELLSKGENYLTNYYRHQRDLETTEGKMQHSYQADARAFYLFISSSLKQLSDQALLMELTNFTLDHQDLLSNYGKLYLLLHLQQLTEKGITEHTDLIDQLHQDMQSQLSIDPRGMFVRVESAGSHFSLHNSDHKLTALYLKALIQSTGSERFAENPFMPKMIRWLIKSRKDGTWQNTQATIAVLDAFSDFFKKGKENLADYEGYIVVNNKIAKQYQVAGDTLFDTQEVRIKTADIIDQGDQGLILEFFKDAEQQGNLYYDLILSYYLEASQIDAREEGISITKEYYDVEDKKMLNPLTQAKKGDIIKARITVSVAEQRHFVAIESPISSGMELINFRLATSNKALINNDNPDIYEEGSPYSEVKNSYWFWSSPWTHEELRDDRVQLFADYLRTGVYTYDYYLTVTHTGTFMIPPTRAEEMYFPEVFGRTKAEIFTVE